ncbi:DUF721 domain-containing protein [Atopomonas sediminilitoris]|uniref:DUF721 domain-containing protein n=1 Tax=Atopomonas sediminilitoris TaxID=2919919 RepID=UPI001F4DB9D9|nr:DUF721 domain-containing protein [Atopomonas sediminilitoris]MCJ8169858.1 DUF721 domain-containing protein [Atopomonas sediminilitoris]
MGFRPLDAKGLKHLLKQGALQSMIKQAAQVEHYQARLEQCLQPAARPFCHVGNLHNGRLLIVVDNSHWATRLRFQEQRLLRQLQATKEFATLTKILIKVHPRSAQVARVSHSARRTPAAAEALHEAADVISDPKLKAALERLASRHEPSKNDNAPD